MSIIASAETGRSRMSHSRRAGSMKMVLDEVIDTFVRALGPFAEGDVVAMARQLPGTLASRPDQLRIVMQASCRSGVRARPVLVTVVGDELIITSPQRGARAWPQNECSVTIDQRPLGGVRIAVTTGGPRLILARAMPVDEAPRLAWLVGRGPQASPSRESQTGLDMPYSLGPPIARLGSAAALYDDRISFPEGPSRALGPDVVARVLELDGNETVLRSITVMMRGARGKARHVLIEGPGWSQVIRAPDSAPELADGFVEVVNHRARG